MKSEESCSFFPICFSVYDHFFKLDISMGHNHNLLLERKWSCFP